MRTYEVTLTAGKTMNLGGLGTARLMYGARVQAPSPAEAGEAALAKAAADPGWADYKRVVEVKEVFTWAITLRGRDRRKRETYIVQGETLRGAFRSLSYNSNVYHFAGPGPGRWSTIGSRKGTDPKLLESVIKVVNTTTGETVPVP